jgi:glutathione synthase/RimK-type ligase-like ATP-grasp enzyme
MLDRMKEVDVVKRIRKSRFYSRARQYFPMLEPFYVDDRNRLDEAEIVKIEWPASVKKPYFGIVQDFGEYPKWSKYRRFLENNSFEYDLFQIHRHDWIEQADRFDVIIGIPSNSLFHLQEMRNKYYVLETFLGKGCYPSVAHANLYEDKYLEAYISQATGIPFAKTYVSCEKADAIQLAESMRYPCVSKVVPSSGSCGVELVCTPKHGREIVKEAFSRNGRKTHVLYSRQKNYIYFQEYIPNDGYDIRVIIVGNLVFGYYRKVLKGDFRASGMNIKERRALPEEAMKIGRRVNEIIRSPLLAVDMVHGLDGKYHVIEFSPYYLMGYSDDLRVNGVPGVYVFDEDGSYHFEKGRFWVAELALREFLLGSYLPMVISRSAVQ